MCLLNEAASIDAKPSLKTSFRQHLDWGDIWAHIVVYVHIWVVHHLGSVILLVTNPLWASFGRLDRHESRVVRLRLSLQLQVGWIP